MSFIAENKLVSYFLPDSKAEKALVLSWADAQASFFKMDQTQKSRGFKSGDEGGHNSFLQKAGK